MAADEDAAADYAPLPTKKKEPTETEKRRQKIVPGSLMKAEMRPGGGDAKPLEGDQVIYHCTVRTLEGVAVESTRSEYGGKGIPIRQVLGKSKMLLGVLEGISTMLKGEVAMFKMKPQMHYGEDDCPLSPPSSFPKEDELHFEIELIDFSKVKARVSEFKFIALFFINHYDFLWHHVVSDDLGVTKKVIHEGQGWETPREPYEAQAWISARTTDGKVIISHTKGEPYSFTFGKSEVPKGLEMGMGTMTREEKAIIYVTMEYLTESPLLSVAEGYDELYFEVELVHFIQVRDMLGDGRLIKRRIRDGKGEFPMDCPLHDSLLRVHYKGMLLNEEKRVFIDTRVDNDGQPLEFSSGEGLVPEGFEMCVRLMLPGEIALVTCPPDYAYDKFPRPANVPEGTYIQWEIELLSFDMPKDWTGMDFQSIMADAEKTRSIGNRLFKEGKFELAKAKYEKVLDANPAHAKALYRRGMAYMEAADFEEARGDFEMMMKVDKSSEPDAKAALQKLKLKMQEVERKARKQFKGLFDKKPGEISDAGTEGVGDEKSTNEGKNNDDKEDSDGLQTKDLPESTANERRDGSFSLLQPTNRRLLSTFVALFPVLLLGLAYLVGFDYQRFL
ncbi:hypothetical protein Tsubulata_022486 [Turnera subulata]|uniref:peptidylprolyl isomerase n=1 Tax=Turnera subulata TaxID=218843 RepID=A0A9Q0FN03_9ROSI|nr:hypothetical protein Tsubulata_022486 [Turnera subulata]